MAFRRNKKGLAIVGLFLFLMGVAVPAAFGLLTEKAMDLGVGDLLDKSTDWDESNIANSTYFVKEQFSFYDNQTGQRYDEQIVFDDSQGLDIAMADNSVSPIASWSGIDKFIASVYLNKTALSDNVDKIVVLYKISDPAGYDMSNYVVTVKLYSSAIGDIYSETLNATVAVNNTLRVEIPIDAIKRLKISSLSESDDLYIWIALYGKGLEQWDLDNVIAGYRVELYDVKKVNASAASNIMLAVSGVLGWLGALAATPYWNPYANREHRNVRRVGRVVRRIRRR